ncbi:autotransporter domain-containing protein [Morganella psychrotolerans]|uniref:autotransporter domain-containing protein n=1 Tax=Morganella psychrotolerans TaxID=368603 RepID=UPI0039AED896
MSTNKQKVFKKSLLALMFFSGTSFSFAAIDYELSALETIGQATAISADGSVVGGTYEIAADTYRPFLIKNGQSVDLSKIQSEGKNTYITGISADGKVITGSIRDMNSGGVSKAYIYNTDTGNLYLSDSPSFRETSSSAISGDGKTMVGIADNRAFRFSEEKGFSLLDSGDTAFSGANGVNTDGSVIVGRSTNKQNNLQAFKYTDSTGVVSLGSLIKDNDGESSASAISSNGLVAVGWSVANENGDMHAFRHTDIEGIRDLGTLRKDNSGFSMASSVSRDGQFIVGSSSNEGDYSRAFVYVSDEKKMYELKPLENNLAGESSAEAISDDGKVVAGYVQGNNNETTAVLWKLNYTPEHVIPPEPVIPATPLEPSKPVMPVEPLKPIGPEISNPVDVNKTRQSLSKMVNNSDQILDLYQTALYNLADSRCQMGSDSYCVGLFTQYDNVQKNNRVATGLFGSFRLRAENWTTGASLNFANNTNLAEGYDTRGSHHPAAGAWLRYQENMDNTGFSSELSAAFLQQGLEITRKAQKNTEEGKGSSDIKGYYISLQTGYGIALSEQTKITPSAVLKYHDVSRAGYTESDNINFPAVYGRAGNKNLDLQLGVNINHRVNESIEFDGGIGADIRINHKRDAFTGLIRYVNDSDYIYDRGESQSVKPYVNVGLNYTITPDSTLRANVGYHTTDYRNDGVQVGLSYSYHW